MSEYTEYLDDLVDMSEAETCLEEAFEIDEATARASMLEWFKILQERFSK